MSKRPSMGDAFKKPGAGGDKARESSPAPLPPVTDSSREYADTKLHVDIGPDFKKHLKILAVTSGESQKFLVLKALNLLFRDYGETELPYPDG